ncbi:MAG: AraC family transcriptional regulator [Clostridia bacterium]|nr:AraC family transcriptional regulator [Clostridia bacterium]
MNGKKTKFYVNSKLKPITPRQCGMQECPPEYSFGPFTRDFWVLHFVTGGKGYFTNSKGTMEIREDQIFVIRPYEVTSYTADKNDPWTYIWIGFSSELPIPLPLILNDSLYAPELRDVFTAAYNNLEISAASPIAYEHFLCGSVWQLLGVLKQGEEKPHATSEGYVNAAINIMKYEFHKSITVTEITERLHIARTYFSEIFKAQTGVSPKKYLDDLRMEKAAELLIKHNVNASATASSVGYPDVFAFSRAFKRYYKYSPTEYVKKYKTQGFPRPPVLPT